VASAQEYRSEAAFSVIISPTMTPLAEDNKVHATITGERKVMGLCHIHDILTEITHTLCCFIHNDVYQMHFMGFPFL
jgi:hypothetical protein